MKCDTKGCNDTATHYVRVDLECINICTACRDRLKKIKPNYRAVRFNSTRSNHNG